MEWTPTPCDWSMILIFCLCIFISLIYASISYLERDFKQKMVNFFFLEGGGACPHPLTELSPVPAGGLTVPPNHQLIYKCSCFTPVVRNSVPKLSPGYTTEITKIFQIFRLVITSIQMLKNKPLRWYDLRIIFALNMHTFEFKTPFLQHWRCEIVCQWVLFNHIDLCTV